jgi:hypothetical protein
MSAFQLALALKGTGYAAIEGFDEDLYELHQVQGLDGQDLPTSNLIADDLTAEQVLEKVKELTAA